MKCFFCDSEEVIAQIDDVWVHPFICRKRDCWIEAKRLRDLHFDLR